MLLPAAPCVAGRRPSRLRAGAPALPALADSDDDLLQQTRAALLEANKGASLPGDEDLVYAALCLHDPLVAEGRGKTPVARRYVLDGDGYELTPKDVVRGILRWTRLGSLSPRAAAALAMGEPALLRCPASAVVQALLALQQLLPAGTDVGAILAGVPPTAVLALTRFDADTVLLPARGALAELRALGLRDAVLRHLLVEEPALLFGGALGLQRITQLRDAWAASGLDALSEAELEREAASQPAFGRFVVSRLAHLY